MSHRSQRLYLKQRRKRIVPQPVTPADAMSARHDLPLVQRQPAEHRPTATAAQQDASHDKSAVSAQPQVVPSQPVVQRQASEPSTSAVVPETVAKEMAEQSQADIARDLPLVQRQSVEQKPTAAAPQQPTAAEKAVAPTQPQAVRVNR